ncbi:MAG: hypothetical protein M3O50_17110, partial [Myxococcota bacterium]|nr:hypothetical protein [Myxococcota bacterium]
DAGGDGGGPLADAGYDGGSVRTGAVADAGPMGNSDDAGAFGGVADAAAEQATGQPGLQSGGCSIGNGRATDADGYGLSGLFLLAAAFGDARRRRGRRSR